MGAADQTPILPNSYCTKTASAFANTEADSWTGSTWWNLIFLHCESINKLCKIQQKQLYNYFSNSLIIYSVDYKSLQVYHITWMCLDTQWKQYTTLQWNWCITLKYAQWQLGQNQWIFFFSEVTLTLYSLIFLFKPIYKNIYLIISKLDIFENRKNYVLHVFLDKLCHSPEISSQLLL